MPFFLTCIAAIWLTVLGGQTQTPQTPQTPQSFCTIGASVTCGFTHRMTPPIHHLPLRHYLAACLQAPLPRFHDHANSLFFMKTLAAGDAQVEAAIADHADITIGIDFLFWYCYGVVPDESQRLSLLEKGLDCLTKITRPLVIGDIPDAHAAAGGILHHAQVPTKKTIAAANLRIRAWAATRPHVLLIPLTDFMTMAAKNEALGFRQLTWPAGTSRRLLQEDLLHTTPAGCAALSLLIMHHVVDKKWLPATAVRWDAPLVERTGIQLAEAQLRASKKPSPSKKIIP